MLRNCLTLKYACVLALAGLTAACSSGGEETTASAPAAASQASSEAPAAAPAASGETASATGIHGKVALNGPRPERAAVDTGADPKCAEMHATEPLLSEREVISEAGGVQWAFVQVLNPPKQDYAVPSAPVVLDQVGCTYTPHVLGMMAGQDLEVRNSDPTLHNVRSIARINRSRNFGQPAGTEPRIMSDFVKPEEAVRMKCDVHPWMTGFVFVLDHPYFAVTDENGHFEIAGLPAGEYEVEVWHEKYRKQKGTVTVGDSGLAELNFAYDAE